MKYQDFIDSKIVAAENVGIELDLSGHKYLFPFQRRIVELSLKRGRAAIFADTGLGKARMGLAWADALCNHLDLATLLLTPCAVGQQIQKEGRSIGIQARVVSDMGEVDALYKQGIRIFIANYEKLHKFDPAFFGAIVLDESSILKGFTSKYRALLTEFAIGIEYRLALTATPSPNDLLEIINHADWLGVMRGREAIAMFFTQDGNTTKRFRLKNTCKADFWKWVASWAVCVQKPSDLGGFSDDGYNLPPLNIQDLTVESAHEMTTLIPVDNLSLSERRQARKDSMPNRVKATADLVNASEDCWVIWCDFNDESDALAKAIPDAVEARGSMTIEQKESAIAGFSDGSIRVLISKPSITGFGLNWQHCYNTVFVGVSDSFEQQYQAIRRFYRFGQKKQVNVYLVASQQEQAVLLNLKRKEKQSAKLYSEVKKYMAEVIANNGKVKAKAIAEETIIESGANWQVRLGDNISRIKELADNSIGLGITSVPFPGMYAYTDDPRDMGNVKDYDEFFTHMDFLIPELLRVMQQGRTFCIHLTQGVSMVSREGFMGLKDFRGDTIRAFQKHGFIYASEVTIDQCPQLEAVRNNTHGLLFKSLSQDASIMRMGLADYVLMFRKPGKNENPIKAGKSSKYNPGAGWITEEEWIEWASPVWYRHVATDGRLAQSQPSYPALSMKALHQGKGGKKFNGINDTDVANVAIARSPEDERHLCPLQFGIIERCVKLFSNPGDLVLDPFNGVGSTGIKAIELGRDYTGIEIKPSYFATAVKYLRQAESGSMQRQTTIFDLIA